MDNPRDVERLRPEAIEEKSLDMVGEFYDWYPHCLTFIGLYRRECMGISVRLNLRSAEVIEMLDTSTLRQHYRNY